MPKLKNISNGPRGLHTTKGLVMVEAGQEVDVELAKGEEPVKDWFAAPGSKAAKEADADDAKADDKKS
jgi:hypothetical protein